MRRYWGIWATLLLLAWNNAHAQDADKLYYTLRNKVLSVKDYIADVKMKVDVPFMQVPLLRGKLYFKAPDKMRLERQGGISILPKNNMNLTLSNLIPTGAVTVIDAGTEMLNGKQMRILKVIPNDEITSIVLSKIWVDEGRMLVMRTETTTRNDGTISMNLKYGNYSSYALPDEVVVHLNLKDYKLPEGVTMDYDNVPQTAMKQGGKKLRKGTITIDYLKYAINTDVPDAVFSKK